MGLVLTTFYKLCIVQWFPGWGPGPSKGPSIVYRVYLGGVWGIHQMIDREGKKNKTKQSFEVKYVSMLIMFELAELN